MARKNKTKTDLGVLTEDLGMQINAFPKSISLDYNNYNNSPKLVMKLTKEAAGFSNPINMQDNRACFEAWCLIIKAKTKEQKLEIELDVKDITEADYDGNLPENGHLGRFLYRILKFSEQYKDWFKLSEKLENLKDKFKTYLDSHTFVTSTPDKEPKEDIANSNLESYVEYLFCDSISAQKDILNLHSGPTIDRQLPVSLFDATKSNETGVFTGGKSAIDFWAVDGDNEDIINVYELKSGNPMVGIITEIFFYSNYVHDVFISKSLDHGNGSVKIEDGTYRSYDKIDGNQVKKVKGIMLSNSNGKIKIKGWHSRLDALSRAKIKEIMNENDMSGAIQYEFLEYKLNKFKIGGYYISKP